jgi:hypothetical protein
MPRRAINDHNGQNFGMKTLSHQNGYGWIVCWLLLHCNRLCVGCVNGMTVGMETFQRDWRILVIVLQTPAEWHIEAVLEMSQRACKACVWHMTYPKDKIARRCQQCCIICDGSPNM